MFYKVPQNIWFVNIIMVGLKVFLVEFQIAVCNPEQQ